MPILTFVTGCEGNEQVSKSESPVIVKSISVSRGRNAHGTFVNEEIAFYQPSRLTREIATSWRQISRFRLCLRGIRHSNRRASGTEDRPADAVKVFTARSVRSGT